MKIKLLAAALSLSLVACTEKQPKASEPKEEVNMVQTYIETSEPKLDFEYIYNETNGKQRFSRAVSKEEENLFFNKMLDSRDDETQSDVNRFNRKLNEPNFSEEELLKRETKVKELLNQCSTLIGFESSDPHYDLNVEEGVYDQRISHTTDDLLYQKTTPIYLSGRMLKCVNYLYLKDSPDKSYNFSDFEYPSKDHIVPEQKQKIEKLYEQIYLEVKAAGLLRKIFYTYYPKSFLREHADQTGLTKFIQDKEAKAGRPLKHDELAAEFFSSREKWIESFEQFLDQKVINSKIETQVILQTDKAA